MSAVLHLCIVEVAARTAARDVARAEARRWLFTAWIRILRALRDPALATRVAPPVPGATLPLGARVPGTSLELDPASAAASLGLLLQHAPPDPATLLAPLLAAGDYAARRADYAGVAPPTVATLLEVQARSAAIQSALAAAFDSAVRELYPARQSSMILGFFADPAALDALALDACVARLVRN